jgi:glyoxylase-like metal-dependent hydrolase (beta-lactamase superfamily II)
MQEVLPGVFHWTAIHPSIHTKVSSWWIEDGGVAIDPLEPEAEGIEWFSSRSTQPQVVLLSNRHHYRHADRFAERYGSPVQCIRAGLHEFGPERPVEGFDFGDELPGGVVVHEVDAICPDDTAFYLPGTRAVLFADGLVRGGQYGGGGPLGFVPDSLMDDPEGTKRGLLESFARILEELDFDHLLLAHGGPVIGDGRVLLRELVDSGGRTAFEL